MLDLKAGQKPLFSLILVFTLIRLLIANLINLGNDEVYYFTYAVLPDWNHFDHPPLVGAFIRIFTFNLQLNNEVMVRLPGIIAAAVNTWLIARCGELVKNRRTGLIAALLYNTSIYTSIISGIFILPDSVQLVFWLAALCTMLRTIQSGRPLVIHKNLLLTGLWIGLAVMSKVHGVFLWFGFLGFIIIDRRGLLKSPYLYVSIAITVLIASPILFWNISNDFVTWRFHSERVTVTEQGIDLKAFFRTLIGQILYANPVQITLFVLTGRVIARRQNFLDASAMALLLWCSIPIILCTTLVSIFRDTLPHWSGPGFIGLMPVAAAWVETQVDDPARRFYPKMLNTCVTVIAFVFIAGPLLIKSYPGTMSPKPFPKTGSGDATLDITGWEQLLPAFEKLRNDDIVSGKIRRDAPLVVHKWFPGAHIYYHVAYPLDMRVIGVGELNDLHQFCWLNKLYGRIPAGADAWYISPSNNFTNPVELYGDAFRSIEKAATITQRRSGRVARYWFVYRLKNAERAVGYQITDSVRSHQQ